LAGGLEIFPIFYLERGYCFVPGFQFFALTCP